VTDVLLPRDALTVVAADAWAEQVQTATAVSVSSRFRVPGSGFRRRCRGRGIPAGQGRGRTRERNQMLRPLSMVPRTATVRAALQTRQRDGAHLARVPDPADRVPARTPGRSPSIRPSTRGHWVKSGRQLRRSRRPSPRPGARAARWLRRSSRRSCGWGGVLDTAARTAHGFPKSPRGFEPCTPRSRLRWGRRRRSQLLDLHQQPVPPVVAVVLGGLQWFWARKPHQPRFAVVELVPPGEGEEPGGTELAAPRLVHVKRRQGTSLPLRQSPLSAAPCAASRRSRTADAFTSRALEAVRR
jgi:hypothetical protein